MSPSLARAEQSTLSDWTGPYAVGRRGLLKGKQGGDTKQRGKGRSDSFLLKRFAPQMPDATAKICSFPRSIFPTSWGQEQMGRPQPPHPHPAAPGVFVRPSGLPLGGDSAAVVLLLSLGARLCHLGMSELLGGR